MWGRPVMATACRCPATSPEGPKSRIPGKTTHPARLLRWMLALRRSSRRYVHRRRSPDLRRGQLWSAARKDPDVVRAAVSLATPARTCPRTAARHGVGPRTETSPPRPHPLHGPTCRTVNLRADRTVARREDPPSPRPWRIPLTCPHEPAVGIPGERNHRATLDDRTLAGVPTGMVTGTPPTPRAARSGRPRR